MIITHLIGGIGNQMFQYAIARNLAELNSSIIKLDVSSFNHSQNRKYGLNSFNIIEQFCYIEEINNITKQKITFKNVVKNYIYNNNKYIQQKSNFNIIETNLNYDPKIIELKGNIYLKGYWQNEKYFQNIKEIIKREFSFKFLPSPLNQNILNNINNCNSISIHVRLGDYITNHNINKIHGTCSMEYYNNSITYIETTIKNPKFYIFSDNIYLAKTIFKNRKDFEFISINNETNSYEDLRLMSNCKHQIIANSTFSWWAAWLNSNKNKIVIAPKIWFSDIELNNQCIDIVPKEWIRL